MLKIAYIISVKNKPINNSLLYDNIIVQVDESGKIIHLETRCPWKRHLIVLTEKLSLPDLCVKFVIYKHEMWLVQASAIDREIVTHSQITYT